MESLQDGTDVSNASSTARNTMLSNKLNSVLSASYADSEIRDSLSLLDLRGFENNADSRRRLRLDAQQEVIDCNAAVIKDFGKVAEQLARIGNMISTLNQTCDEMRKHIQVAQDESAPILEEASVLLTQRDEIESKHQLLEAFNQHFIPSEEEIATLTSIAEPVDDKFFFTFSKIKKVHEDCKVLLENENQRLGLELMEQISRSIIAAYKKLHTWVQKEFKTLDLDDPHISGSVRRALRTLAERPSLFQSCLDYFAESREHNLSNAFHAALTDNINTSASEFAPSSKPIEFSTHDLLRYVGDMLAWVHSAAVSEREALEGLFISDAGEIAKGIEIGRQHEPWSAVRRDQNQDEQDTEEETAFDGRSALSSLVNRNLAEVTKTLRQRIEFAVRSNEDAIVVYKTTNLIAFYLDIFSKLIGENSTLSQAIRDLQTSSFSHFEQLMGDEVTQISQEATLSEDLSPPRFLMTALDRVSLLLKSYSSSFRATASESTPSAGLARLVSVALTPFLDQCSELSSSLPEPGSTAPPDPSLPIYQLNYLLPVRAALLPYLEQSSETASLSASLQSTILTLTDSLTSLQRDYLLDASGLNDLLSSLPNDLSNFPDELPSAFSSIALSQSAAQLDTILPSALMDSMENIRSLSNKVLARRCTEEAVDLFCSDFETVVDWMEGWDESHGGRRIDDISTEDHENGATDLVLREIYPRRPEEVRVLLS